MAVVWEKKLGGRHYEVRAAGRTRRLYTDGVFHSQYNPASPLTGHVWDLLMLPAFFRPPGAIRRVVVLGVGGGTVIAQLRHFVRPAEIVGVDLNPVHLYVARRFFGLTPNIARLEQSDAVQWVRAYRGPAFDMVVDDLFGEQDGQPVRAVEANAGWFGALLRLLTPRGLLVANFASPERLRRSAYFSNRRVASRFSAAFQLTTPADENSVGAFLRQTSDSRALRNHLTLVPGLTPGLKSRGPRYRIRRLRALVPG